jgi:hypothetical protein
VWRDSEPKRATAARRTLALPPIAAAALAERKAASGTSVGLVFATATGNPFNPRHVYKVFARVARRAGIEGGFPYLMRHSAASLMLDAGASLDEVADVLGDEPRDATAPLPPPGATCGLGRAPHGRRAGRPCHRGGLNSGTRPLPQWHDSGATPVASRLP